MGYMDKFKNNVKRAVHPMICPYEGCGISLMPQVYEKHCEDEHDLNRKIQCAWCKGKTVWLSRQKFKHAKHLHDCSLPFVKPERLAAAPPATTTTTTTTTTNPTVALRLFDLKHLYLEKELYHHTLPADVRRLRFENVFDEFLDLASEEYDCMNPLHAEPHPVQFRDESVNLAASYIRHFKKTQNTHEWNHAMVKAVAFESFAIAMKEHPRVRMLKFSCWCNGGDPDKEARYRVHRHAILVCPNGEFEPFWKKIEAPDKPYGQYRCMTHKELKTPTHLLNLMGYVSHPRSTCDSKEARTLKKNRPYEPNHFYFTQTLPADYEFILAPVWEDGLAKIMYQKMFQHVSVPEVVKNPMTLVGSQWRQKIKDFYGFCSGFVLPVTPDWTATRSETPFFLHLLNGRKLYFEKVQEQMMVVHHDPIEKTWLSRQAEGGNCFFDNVGEELWTPRKSDQAVLNYYRPVLEERDRLAAENADLRKEVADLKEQEKTHLIKINGLLEEIKHLNEVEITRLKRTMQYLKNENEQTKLKMENENKQLKLENEQLKLEIEQLKNSAQRLTEVENEKYTAEI